MFFDFVNIDLLDGNELNEFQNEAIDSYIDGWQCGYTWPDKWNHKPGGPWVYTANSCGCINGCNRQVSPRFTCKEQLEYARLSAEKHNLWIKGWSQGHALKIKEGKSCTVEEHVLWRKSRK